MPVLRKRIQARGIDFEQSIETKYLEELVEKYLTKEHDRVIMKEFNNEKEIKSVGLTEFFS